MTMLSKSGVSMQKIGTSVSCEALSQLLHKSWIHCCCVCKYFSNLVSWLFVVVFANIFQIWCLDYLFYTLSRLTEVERIDYLFEKWLLCLHDIVLLLLLELPFSAISPIPFPKWHWIYFLTSLLVILVIFCIENCYIYKEMMSINRSMWTRYYHLFPEFPAIGQVLFLTCHFLDAYDFL